MEPGDTNAVPEADDGAADAGPHGDHHTRPFMTRNQGKLGRGRPVSVNSMHIRL